jgi:Rad3-related DNA helicase
VTLALPSPVDLGAPATFARWRPGQSAAVEAAINSHKRFLISNLPTGAGKSLIYIIQSILTCSRTAVLTSTKALQSQLLADFAAAGLIEIRGLNSYECIEGRPNGMFRDAKREGYRAERGMPMACDEAPCQAGAECYRRDNGCLYYDAYRRAFNPNSRLVVTNYAYWMSIHEYGDGLGAFDMLVMDEAHNAMDELGSFIGTELNPYEVSHVLGNKAGMPKADAPWLEWKIWGANWAATVAVEMEVIRLHIKERERVRLRVPPATIIRSRDLRRIHRKLKTLARMDDQWVIDWTRDDKSRDIVKFDPVWPGTWAEEKLFLGIKKVVMVSATIRPKTAAMLGVAPANIDFREWPSNFPVRNRPIVWVPTARIDFRTKESTFHTWIKRIDHIIGRRLDRKGIIHSVSYTRAKEIQRHSEYGVRMMLHDSTNTREVIEAFKRSKDPVILVSPSVTTGYDFKGDYARWQIIAKVPFPDSRDLVMKARVVRDKEYRDYVTIVNLIQMAGRIVRAEDDWGETFIIDDHFSWLFNHNRHMIPRWFAESVRVDQTLGLAMTPGRA